MIVAIGFIVFALALALWFALTAAESPILGIVIGVAALLWVGRAVRNYRRWRQRDEYLERRRREGEDADPSGHRG